MGGGARRARRYRWGRGTLVRLEVFHPGQVTDHAHPLLRRRGRVCRPPGRIKLPEGRQRGGRQKAGREVLGVGAPEQKVEELAKCELGTIRHGASAEPGADALLLHRGAAGTGEGDGRGGNLEGGGEGGGGRGGRGGSGGGEGGGGGGGGGDRLEAGEPRRVVPLRGIEHPSRVVPPSGIEHPSRVVPPSGIEHPSRVVPPSSIEHPSRVVPPGGIEHPQHSPQRRRRFQRRGIEPRRHEAERGRRARVHKRVGPAGSGHRRRCEQPTVLGVKGTEIGPEGRLAAGGGAQPHVTEDCGGAAAGETGGRPTAPGRRATLPAYQPGIACPAQTLVSVKAGVGVGLAYRVHQPLEARDGHARLPGQRW
eukprot:scaffold5189_cov117-Isochrysis_galbana.AAC.1